MKKIVLLILPLPQILHAAAHENTINTQERIKRIDCIVQNLTLFMPDIQGAPLMETVLAHEMEELKPLINGLPEEQQSIERDKILRSTNIHTHSTITHEAARRKKISILKCLAPNAEHLFQQDKNGNTPLHVVAPPEGNDIRCIYDSFILSAHSDEVIDYLLTQGACPHIENNDNLRPIEALGYRMELTQDNKTLFGKKTMDTEACICATLRSKNREAQKDKHPALSQDMHINNSINAIIAYMQQIPFRRYHRGHFSNIQYKATYLLAALKLLPEDQQTQAMTRLLTAQNTHNGRTIVHLLTETSSSDLLAFLPLTHEHINVIDIYGQTALFLARYQSDAQLLLSKGACPHVTDNDHQKPLECMLHKKYIKQGSQAYTDFLDALKKSDCHCPKQKEREQSHEPSSKQNDKQKKESNKVNLKKMLSKKMSSF